MKWKKKLVIHVFTSHHFYLERREVHSRSHFLRVLVQDPTALLVQHHLTMAKPAQSVTWRKGIYLPTCVALCEAAMTDEVGWDCISATWSSQITSQRSHLQAPGFHSVSIIEDDGDRMFIGSWVFKGKHKLQSEHGSSLIWDCVYWDTMVRAVWKVDQQGSSGPIRIKKEFMVCSCSHYSLRHREGGRAPRCSIQIFHLNSGAPTTGAFPRLSS